MKFLVLLSGCGLGDGSAIEEVILVYTILDKYSVNYTPVVQNINFTSVNHFT
ncbi:MAG: isoprenoid biosynthesis protein ElbB, partial [Tissierella sp.]|nr:isoprenoid biosynthesis protein ElbB [Tissierella sp.]